MRAATFWNKLRGGREMTPPRVNPTEIIWSWVGAMIGIGLVSWINQGLPDGPDRVLMVGSLGASAVLVFGAPRSPLAQPRNLIGGHLVSALVGILSWQLLHEIPWLAASVAVATAIALMHWTRTLHPPGGATALIAVIGSEPIHQMGWFYALYPGLLAPGLLLLAALLCNNLPSSRHYPDRWW